MIAIRYQDDGSEEFHQIFQDDEYEGIRESYFSMIRFWDHVRLEWEWQEETIILYQADAPYRPEFLG